MGPHRDEPRLLSGRGARQGREALVLLASAAVLLVALAAGRRAPSPAPAASPADPGAPPLPPPLPSGAEPARIPLPDHEMEAGCAFADRGFGAYGAWRPLPLGKALVPPGGALGPGGEYDLLVHFHGAEPVRKELAPLDLGLVVAAVDAGTRTSDYDRALRGAAWDELLASVDRAVDEATGAGGARARHVAVSSWSAGSGAVAQILAARGKERVDALVLLDSLYAGYAPGRAELLPGQLATFVGMATSAARGRPLFYLTHTAVPTSGYASTEATASFLLRELGASPIPVSPVEGDPLQLTRMYDGGSLFVRGYAGGTRDDHCAQLRLLPAIVVDHILPAFAL